MPPRIFISYRREDAAGDAGRLADHLHRRFGKDRVFLDIDTIDPGTDFVQVLQTSLQETAAVLVVIGPRWTSLRDAAGVRRLESPHDFVRLEVEAALGRSIPVVPVLVQGATMPRAEDLPASLAALVNRQAVGLDHAEFHDDAERLCDRLEAVIAGGSSTRLDVVRRWWPAAAVVAVLALGLVAYFVLQTSGTTAGTPDNSPVPTPTPDGRTVEESARAEELVAEALAQRRRNQFVEALATLARAREAAPNSPTVREAQDDVAMDWIRNVRVESGKSTFAEAIKPSLAVIDASLPSATGMHRADLLAHTGWATFLLRRDGDRRLNPADAYHEALSIDPVNPYANAMLAHWVLLQEDDVPRGVKLFETALQSGRALDAVRALQWAGYGNVRTPEADVERVRLADAMRRAGERPNGAQAQALWGPYYFGMAVSREKEREMLLDALPPDDHIRTLEWAFEDHAAKDDSRRQTIRYYVALLDARAGRNGQAIAGLRALNKELADSPGSLRDAVQAALKQLQSGRRGRPAA